jgi:hypothetical protein
VTPEGKRTVTYDIGADGSVLKWQDAEKPPTIENIFGTLYANRGKEVNNGVQNLVVLASSPQGIASIQVVANGTNLVDEKTCTEDIETEVVECSPLINEWVMETEDFTPGRLNLEVIVKSRVEGVDEISAERFWVNIPPPPPPLPGGLPVKPRFKDILNFREEFGLDIWEPVNDETEVNDRVYDLINAWTAGDPVARSSAERWGVPLRVQDVAEMEYRETYVLQNGALIQQWAATHAPATYGGYYVDHRAGGIMRIGFTADQAELVTQLKEQVGLSAANRVAGYPSSPNDSIAELTNLQMTIAEQDSTTGPLAGLITRVGIDLANNRVKVGSLNAGQVEAGLHSAYGSNAPIVAYADQSEPLEGHFTDDGPVQPGIAVGFAEENKPNYCTAGFAAKEKTSKINQATGQPFVERFLLIAGHCWATFKNSLGFVVRRFNSSKDPTPSRIGTVARRSNNFKVKQFSTDAAAIRLDGDVPLSPSVFREGASPGYVSGTVTPAVGMIIHKSGATSKKVKTGYITGPAEPVGFLSLLGPGEYGPYFLVPNTMPGAHGDSGGPIWTTGGKAVGLVSFGGPEHSAFSPLQPPELPDEWGAGHRASREQAPGILHAPGMGPGLYISTSP